CASVGSTRVGWARRTRWGCCSTLRSPAPSVIVGLPGMTDPLRRSPSRGTRLLVLAGFPLLVAIAIGVPVGMTLGPAPAAGVAGAARLARLPRVLSAPPGARPPREARPRPPPPRAGASPAPAP